MKTLVAIEWIHHAEPQDGKGYANSGVQFTHIRFGRPIGTRFYLDTTRLQELGNQLSESVLLRVPLLRLRTDNRCVWFEAKPMEACVSVKQSAHCDNRLSIPIAFLQQCTGLHCCVPVRTKQIRNATMCGLDGSTIACNTSEIKRVHRRRKREIQSSGGRVQAAEYRANAVRPAVVEAKRVAA